MPFPLAFPPQPLVPARRPPLLCTGGALLSFVFLLGPVLPAFAMHPSQPPRTAGLRGNVNGRPPGYLGIEFHDMPDDQLKTLRLPSGRGVEVVMVDHDGPAGKAGLRPRDIIVSLNGQALAGAEALRRMIHDAGAGVQIALTVIRGGSPLTLKADLADRDQVARAAMAHLAESDAPSSAEPVAAGTVLFGFNTATPPESPASPAYPPPPPTGPATPPPGSGFIGHIVHGSIYTGAVLDTMEPQLAIYFGAPQGAGLLVHSVLPGSPAAVAGLRAGDIVLRADLYTLRNTNDWAKRLHAAKGRPIALSVLREHRELNLTLQQELKHHSLVEWPTLH